MTADLAAALARLDPDDQALVALLVRRLAAARPLDTLDDLADTLGQPEPVRIG